VGLIAALFLATSPARKTASKFDLPDDLARYREWSELVKVPHEVPLELSILCVMPKREDWDEAARRHGPHTRKFIRVYGNAAAVEALTAHRQPPVGSVIAKEKFSGVPQGAPDGVAFMVKRNREAFPESGGWEFLYFPAPEEPTVGQHACAPCHRTAKATDYVFGPYPRRE